MDENNMMRTTTVTLTNTGPAFSRVIWKKKKGIIWTLQLVSDAPSKPTGWKPVAPPAASKKPPAPTPPANQDAPKPATPSLVPDKPVTTSQVREEPKVAKSSSGGIGKLKVFLLLLNLCQRITQHHQIEHNIWFCLRRWRFWSKICLFTSQSCRRVWQSTQQPFFLARHPLSRKRLQ